MAYTKEQEKFLDEIYAEDLPIFGEDENDITFEEIYANIHMSEFEREYGRKPTYEEMSRGW